MPDSNDYLDVQFRRDLEQLDLARTLTADVVRTFANFASAKGWPYELKEDAADPPELGQSQSTQAMVLFAIASAAGKVPTTSPLLPSVSGRRPLAEITDEWWKLFLGPASALFDGAQRHVDELRFDSQSHVSWSSSFGWDDPFTLAWLVEVLGCKELAAGATPELRDAVLRRAGTRVDEGFALSNGQPDKKEGPFLTWRWSPRLKLTEELSQKYKEKKRDNVSALDHAFPLLRFVQLGRAIGRDYSRGDETTARVAELMLERVHEHLSRVELRDGSFDGAELVFALEAALLLRPRGVSRPLLTRVFDVLAREQANNPYWRPVKPCVIRPQGHVLFPVSVETASSLLRCCALADLAYPGEHWFSRNIKLFSSYLDWLRGRERRGRCLILDGTEKRAFVGWHSEHVHLHQGIHLWETSQVLLFVSFYAAMLQRHIAERSLLAANLTAKRKTKAEGGGVLARWESRTVGEPLRGLPLESRYRVLDGYFRRYIIEPRHRPAEGGAAPAIIPGAPHYSALLYGPPGTAKTSIAEDVCKALDWPLITITPSDFIHGGEGQIEARAKRIFDVLEAQSEVVVLFDEIDRLILDRDAKAYMGQGDLFQFMTPSMLPKIRDLRKREGPVFLVATNYAERIDAAIKRRGRIDQACLVAPPDFGQRKQIVRDLVRKRLKLKEDADLSEEAERALNAVADATRLFVYGELEQLVDGAVEALATEGGPKVTALVARLAEDARESPPAISLPSYSARFTGEEWAQRPYREFFVVLFLRLEENGSELTDDENRVVRSAFQALLPGSSGLPAKKVATSALTNEIGDDTITSAIVKRLFPA